MKALTFFILLVFGLIPFVGCTTVVAPRPEPWGPHPEPWHNPHWGPHNDPHDMHFHAVEEGKEECDCPCHKH